MSSSDEKNDSSGESDLLDDAFLYQSKKIHKYADKTVEENLPSEEEFKSENKFLSCARSVKVSYQISSQSPTPSSEASYVDTLGENCSSATIYSTPELRNFKNCSSSVNAGVSLQQNPTTSVLKDSDATEAKTNPRNPSPFAANRNYDYSSPPDRDTIPMNRSLSKCLKETNTPSPEKRNVDTDVGSTPIKRLRKTPESESGNSETYRSKLSFLGATKTSYKSPTNLQLQELKVEIQKTKESETLSSQSTPSKRKRNSSLRSEITNDLCLSDSVSSSSAAKTICESTFQGEITVQDGDESATKRKTLVSLGDCSTESNSLAEHSVPDDLAPTANLRALPTEKHESDVSKEPTNAFSDNPSLKIKKQKDYRSISDILDAGALSNFTSKKPDSFVQLKPFIDAPLYESNKVSGKQKGLQHVPDVLFDVEQSYLSVNESKLTVHCPRLPDKASSSIYGPASKFKNSSSKDFEPCIETKDIQGASSASNVSDAAVESQKMDAALSNLMILNPKSFPLVHLPPLDNFSAASVSHRELELDLSADGDDKIEQNLSSTRTLSIYRKLRSPPKDFSIKKRRETHRRSLSDETFTYRNSPEVPGESYQSNVLEEMRTSRILTMSNEPSTSYNLEMRRRSVSDETFTSKNLSDVVPAERNISDSVRGMLTTSQFNESSTSRSLGLRRRSASNETLTFTNLSDVGVQQYHSNSLRNSQSKETSTSRSLPEISEGVSRKICSVKPLFQRMHAQSASDMTSALTYPSEFSNYSTNNQHEITEAHHVNLPSTSRNNTEVQIQQFLNIPIPQRMRERLLSGDASSLRNHPEVVSDVSQRMRERFLSGDTSSGNHPEVVSDVPQRMRERFLSGDTSSGNHPEAVSDVPRRMRERFVSGEVSTAGNQPEVESEINSSSIDDHEEQTFTSSFQPIITSGSSFQDQPNFHTSRNEPVMDTSELNSQYMRTLEALSSRLVYQPLFTSTYASSDEHDSISDYLSSPSDVPQSGEARERMSGFETPLRVVRESEFIAQARFLIRSVLREMMSYNGEDILWRRYERLFLRISESRSDQDAIDLHSHLLRYLANRGYSLWNRNLCTTRERTAETPSMVTYEILLSLVVEALAFTLKQAVTHEFTVFMHIFLNFRALYGGFVSYSTIFNVEDIQDEVSRNRVKARMKKIQSYVTDVASFSVALDLHW